MNITAASVQWLSKAAHPPSICRWILFFWFSYRFTVTRPWYVCRLNECKSRFPVTALFWHYWLFDFFKVGTKVLTWSGTFCTCSDTQTGFITSIFWFLSQLHRTLGHSVCWVSVFDPYFTRPMCRQICKSLILQFSFKSSQHVLKIYAGSRLEKTWNVCTM